MKPILYVFLLFLLVRPAKAQIGMGGQPHPSAVLDLKSPANDKALYPPRLTTIQRKAIVNPQPGAFLYDLDQSTFYLFDGANWLPLAFQNPANIMPTTRLASDGATGDNFGISVAISGDYALVGAYIDDIGANPAQGSAYVFKRTGTSWSPVRPVIDNSPFNTQNGNGVGISNGTFIIGGPGFESNKGKVAFGTVDN